MPDQIPPAALILVGVLKSPRDLEIARLLGWYRIPLRSAPKVVQVDYLAFYQTGSFGEQEGGSIHWVAQVKGVELVYRKELLRDEPNHPAANEEYYKLQIGPLIKLANPVRAENWRRLTFLYTTGEYLLKANKLNDLVVQAEERQILWRSLRERSIHSQPGKLQDLPDFPVDPQLLDLLLGIQNA